MRVYCLHLPRHEDYSVPCLASTILGELSSVGNTKSHNHRMTSTNSLIHCIVKANSVSFDGKDSSIQSVDPWESWNPAGQILRDTQMTIHTPHVLSSKTTLVLATLLLTFMCVCVHACVHVCVQAKGQPVESVLPSTMCVLVIELRSLDLVPIAFIGWAILSIFELSALGFFLSQAWATMSSFYMKVRYLHSGPWADIASPSPGEPSS